MQYCSRCGKAVEDGATVCPACNKSLVTGYGSRTDRERRDLAEALRQLGNPADLSSRYASDDAEHNRVAAVLSYFGLLVLVPLLASPDSRFARFHAGQGLTLLAAEICSGMIGTVLHAVLGGISWRLLPLAALWNLTGILFLGLTVFGIVSALQGKARELPLLGRFRILPS
jgi:uncharacterized membrane protein